MGDARSGRYDAQAGSTGVAGLDEDAGRQARVNRMGMSVRADVEGQRAIKWGLVGNPEHGCWDQSKAGKIAQSGRIAIIDFHDGRQDPTW